MRLAIMGAGAVGGYFGGLLALGGMDVTFIARGEHLRAMQKNGLALETPKGTRAIAFRDACLAAGFNAEVVSDIRAAQWTKFVALATNAALTCLFRLPVGYIYHDPEIIPRALRGFEEVVVVARAMGVALPADTAQSGLALHQSFPRTMYASMYHDLAKGRPMELDSLSGYIVRQGRPLGVPTPIHEIAYLALKPYLHGTPRPLLT